MLIRRQFSNREPFHCTVSDSRFEVHATFTANAVEKFPSQHQGRGVGDLCTGHVLALDRIELLVTRFELSLRFDAAYCCTFGQPLHVLGYPKPWKSCAELCEIYGEIDAQIQGALEHSDAHKVMASSDVNPPASQAGELLLATLSSTNLLQSQMNPPQLATQIRRHDLLTQIQDVDMADAIDNTAWASTSNKDNGSAVIRKLEGAAPQPPMEEARALSRKAIAQSPQPINAKRSIMSLLNPKKQATALRQQAIEKSSAVQRDLPGNQTIHRSLSGARPNIMVPVSERQAETSAPRTPTKVQGASDSRNDTRERVGREPRTPHSRGRGTGRKNSEPISKQDHRPIQPPQTVRGSPSGGAEEEPDGAATLVQSSNSSRKPTSVPHQVALLPSPSPQPRRHVHGRRESPPHNHHGPTTETPIPTSIIANTAHERRREEQDHRKTPAMLQEALRSDSLLSHGEAKGTIDEATPFSSVLSGLRRVLRSYSVIPEDQATILIRPDSHYPPLPGRTFPKGNIPINLLRQLSIEAKGNASLNTPPVDNANSGNGTALADPPPPLATSLPTDAVFQTSHIEPVSSMQTDIDSPIEGWEATPSPEAKRPLLRNGQELPPDSSAPSPQKLSPHRNRQTERAANYQKAVPVSVDLSDDDEMEVDVRKALVLDPSDDEMEVDVPQPHVLDPSDDRDDVRRSGPSDRDEASDNGLRSLSHSQNNQGAITDDETQDMAASADAVPGIVNERSYPTLPVGTNQAPGISNEEAPEEAMEVEEAGETERRETQSEHPAVFVTPAKPLQHLVKGRSSSSRIVSSSAPTAGQSGSSQRTEPLVPCTQPPSYGKPASNAHKSQPQERPSSQDASEVEMQIVNEICTSSQLGPSQTVPHQNQREIERPRTPDHDLDLMHSSPPEPIRELFSNKRPAKNTLSPIAPSRKALRISDNFSQTVSQDPAIEARAQKRAFLAKLPKETPRSQSATHLSNPQPKSLFEDFRGVYPSYTGDEDSFWDLCEQIYNIRGRLQDSRWDDYLIKFTMYEPYLVATARRGQTPLRYVDYYHQETGRPQYREHVITLEKLCKYLEKPVPEQRNASAERRRGLFTRFSDEFSRLKGHDSYRPDDRDIRRPSWRL
jgi:hypothetical protein